MLQAGRSDGLTRFFSWSNPSSRTMALGSTQRRVPGVFLGVKGGRRVMLLADSLENVEASTFHNPMGLQGLLQGLLYFFYLPSVFLSAWREVTIPPPQPCVSYTATKREPGPWVYNWATLELVDINRGTWSSTLGVWRKVNNLGL
jgi:hypothetical protein